MRMCVNMEPAPARGMTHRYPPFRAGRRRASIPATDADLSCSRASAEGELRIVILHEGNAEMSASDLVAGHAPVVGPLSRRTLVKASLSAGFCAAVAPVWAQ